MVIEDHATDHAEKMGFYHIYKIASQSMFATAMILSALIRLQASNIAPLQYLHVILGFASDR